MYFSPQGEKIPKELLRLSPQTPMLLLESAYTRLERCCSARGARTGHHSPCGKSVRLESLRPQAQNYRNALAARSACSAVVCVPLRYANTCREPTEYIFGSHQRSSRRLAASFRSFLVRTRKGHVSLLCQGERYVLFSLRRKAPKDSPRLQSRTLMLLLGSAYPRLPTDGTAHLRALSVIRRAGSDCRWEVCARGRKARAV